MLRPLLGIPALSNWSLSYPVVRNRILNLQPKYKRPFGLPLLYQLSYSPTKHENTVGRRGLEPRTY